MGLFIPLPIRVPSIIKWVYPSWYIWDITSKEKTIYLTFDDGPIPEVTPWVLDLLSKKKVPATFFCIGDNVLKHPQIFNRILSEGHAVGNHTQHHLKGWVTDDTVYIENVDLASSTMENNIESPYSHKEVHTSTHPRFPLFRPPYGKIKRSQANELRNKGYRIIMYRTLAYDWEKKITPQKCLENSTKKAKSGDLIVFHDSIKAFKNLEYALPKMIDYYIKKGYTFKHL